LLIYNIFFALLLLILLYSMVFENSVWRR